MTHDEWNALTSEEQWQRINQLEKMIYYGVSLSAVMLSGLDENIYHNINAKWDARVSDAEPEDVVGLDSLTRYTGD